MKRDVKLYNVIFPIWLIVFLPTWLWLIIIPANLAVDCLVTWLSAKRLGVADIRGTLRHTWWRFWLLGFLADFIGGVWMVAGMYLSVPLEKLWPDTLSGIMHNPFTHPAAFLWTLAGIALAGVCIYLFDRRVLKHCPALDDRQKRGIALAMSLITAPWLFFIPVY